MWRSISPSSSSLVCSVAILALLCCHLSCSSAARDYGVVLDGQHKPETPPAPAPGNRWNPTPAPVTPTPTPVTPTPPPPTPVPGMPVTPSPPPCPPVLVAPPPPTPVPRDPMTPIPSVTIPPPPPSPVP